MKVAVILVYCLCLKLALCQSEDDGSGEQVEPISTTQSTTKTTTRRPARDITNDFMPAPTNISVVARTIESITLKYTPPEDYLNDFRYSHFRVEYSRSGLPEVSRIEVPKNSNFNNLLIIDLQPGALYNFRMKSQGRNLNGNMVVSPSSESVNIRTLPPAIRNLQAQQLISDRKSVLVSWDGFATSLRGPMYNKFVLKFYNTNNPEDIITIPYKHTHSILSLKAPTNISYIAEALELGSVYNFTVYTESGEGNDLTLGEVKFKILRIKTPGPINFNKEDFTTTSIQVSFMTNSVVENISGHRLSYSEVNSGENQTDLNLELSELSYNITDLKPGAIYLIKVYHVTALNLTEPATMYARTYPTPPKNVTVSNLGATSIELSIDVSLNQVYSKLLLQHEFVEKKLFSDAVIFDAAATSVTVKNLTPGGLYNFVLTYVSDTVLKFDETNASSIIQVRTIPNPPSKFSASSRQGKIILNWEKPSGIERPISWSYEIQYFPSVDGGANPTKISLWNRDGATKMFHSLDNIVPGTSYTVLIHTVAGNAQSPVQSRSKSSPELTVLSQPQNPRIDDWVQVSLKLMRLLFTPPSKEASNFDYYILNITRLRSAGSAVEYLPEFNSFKLEKNETSKLLELTPGATYRAVLTTVVGNEDIWLQSVVNSSNSKAFNVWSPYDTHLTFARLRWNFNNCGKSGREGPSQIKCDNSYKFSNLKNLVTVQKGIQYWVVPMDGLYRITGAGAGYEGQGGLGATVSGIYHLKEGSQLKIAVGQRGTSLATDISNMARGGAGGTFVVADDNNKENEPLLVAGGAGSCKDGLKMNNVTNGQLSHNAADASFSGPRFGKGGRGSLAEPGLKGSLNTAGGAGFRGVSESFVLLGDISFPATGYLPYGIAGQNYNDTDAEQYEILLGGIYEAQDGSFSEGGFGGGGNGYIDASGGGGGYTGGGGGPINGYSGGGGSYIKFTGGLQYTEVINSGPGFVRITLVGLPVSSPVPLTLYLVVAFFVGILFTLCCGGLLCLVDKCIGRKYNPKKSVEYLNMVSIGEPVKSEPISNIFEYETSVRVVTDSPPASGLYVQDIPQENIDSLHAKSSPSPSNSTSEQISSDENEYNMDDSKIPLSKWEQNLMSDSQEDEDSKSESTASSVSSMDSDLEISAMGTELDTSAMDDTEPVTSPAEEEETSVYTSSESEETTSSSSGDTDEESTLPPTPPPPPKAEELLSEEQRAAFREKLKMFHEMQSSSGAIV